MNRKFFFVLFGCGWFWIVKAQQPQCVQAIANINVDSLVYFVKNITGKQPVNIGGLELTISSRHAAHPGNNIAAEYLKQTLIQYGYWVEDIPFSASGRNIIGYKPGTINPKKAYLMGAHYDCVGNANMNFEGADDNASGVAAILETARVLKDDSFPNTIVLAFWDEEEIGLLGSAAFAPDGPIGYWDIEASIHLDMIGYDGNNDSLAMVHSLNIGNSSILATKMVEVNRNYDTELSILIKNPGNKSTDHQSFWLKGATAIGLTEDYDRDFSPNWHQLSDSLGNMNIPYFVKMSKLAAAAICEMTQSGSLVAVAELSPAKLTVFPNPVSSFLQLPSQIDWSETQAEVFNHLGVLVYSGPVHNNVINMESLKAGIYILMLKSTEKVYVSRLIKQ
jgi:hypothetical protein